MACDGVHTQLSGCLKGTPSDIASLFCFKSFFSNLNAGIALAFGHEVAPHPDLVSIISLWAKTEDLSAPHFKMARVSKEAQLKFGLDPQTGVKTNFPIVCVQNVYAFPGKSRENRCRYGC